MIKLLRILGELLNRLVALWERHERERISKEKDKKSQEAHADPAGTFADHFGGSVRRANETDEAR